MSGSKRSGTTEKPKLGAPFPPRGSPSEPMIATCGSLIPPAASATPSVRSTIRRIPSLNGGTWPSSASITSRLVTTASTPSFDCVKMSSNDRSIVSVST